MQQTSWNEVSMDVNCKNVRLWKDSLMRTPLQRREWVCRSAACSPYLGQRLAIRRQVPLSARTFPCTGHTLPWQARCCSALSWLINTSCTSERLVYSRLSWAPFTPRCSDNKQEEEKRSSGTRRRRRKKRQSDWEGQSVGLSVSVEGEKTDLRYFNRLCCSPGSSEWDCEDWASFSGSPLEKIPLTVLRHLVEAARSELPVNSASAVESRLPSARAVWAEGSTKTWHGFYIRADSESSSLQETNQINLLSCPTGISSAFILFFF